MNIAAWSPDTQAQMDRLLARSKRKSTVQFSPGFIRAARTETGLGPPLSRLVGGQGGRGGDVRLKLYLCITALATNVRRPTINDRISGPSWAVALGLAKPYDGGGRRVTDALRFLDEEVNLIRRDDPRPSEAPLLRLLHPDGSSRPHPGRVVEDKGSTYWVTVPLEFWSEGWVVVLSGPAVAVYLALCELVGGRRDRPATIDATRRDQYAIKEDTWRRGLNELVGCGLVTAERKMTRESLYKQRLRNHYVLDKARLERGPLSTVDS